jgi:SAM-dependent methyltransferase
MDKSDPSYKGQSGYNAAMLAIYDVWVLKFMTKAVWKVPVAQGVEMYREYMGHRHLDVGPGTGYFLDEANPRGDAEITLLDPNLTVLRHAAKRLERWHPVTVEADVMKPLPINGPFDSAALSFVLHCLRGPEANKAVAVRNVADVLGPEGVLFGGTVLGLQGHHTRSARAFIRAANKQGGFDNLDDTVEGLRRILDASFKTVDVVVVGSAALFSAAGPT